MSSSVIGVAGISSRKSFMKGSEEEEKEITYNSYPISSSFLSTLFPPQPPQDVLMQRRQGTLISSSMEKLIHDTAPSQTCSRQNGRSEKSEREEDRERSYSRSQLSTNQKGGGGGGEKEERDAQENESKREEKEGTERAGIHTLNTTNFVSKLYSNISQNFLQNVADKANISRLYSMACRSMQAPEGTQQAIGMDPNRLLSSTYYSTNECLNVSKRKLSKKTKKKNLSLLDLPPTSITPLSAFYFDESCPDRKQLSSVRIRKGRQNLCEVLDFFLPAKTKEEDEVYFDYYSQNVPEEKEEEKNAAVQRTQEKEEKEEKEKEEEEEEEEEEEKQSDSHTLLSITSESESSYNPLFSLCYNFCLDNSSYESNTDASHMYSINESYEQTIPGLLYNNNTTNNNYYNNMMFTHNIANRNMNSNTLGYHSNIHGNIISSSNSSFDSSDYDECDESTYSSSYSSSSPSPLSPSSHPPHFSSAYLLQTTCPYANMYNYLVSREGNNTSNYTNSSAMYNNSVRITTTSNNNNGLLIPHYGVQSNTSSYPPPHTHTNNNTILLPNLPFDNPPYIYASEENAYTDGLHNNNEDTENHTNNNNNNSNSNDDENNYNNIFTNSNITSNNSIYYTNSSKYNTNASIHLPSHSLLLNNQYANFDYTNSNNNNTNSNPTIGTNSTNEKNSNVVASYIFSSPLPPMLSPSPVYLNPYCTQPSHINNNNNNNSSVLSFIPPPPPTAYSSLPPPPPPSYTGTQPSAAYPPQNEDVYTAASCIQKEEGENNDTLQNAERNSSSNMSNINISVTDDCNNVSKNSDIAQQQLEVTNGQEKQKYEADCMNDKISTTNDKIDNYISAVKTPDESDKLKIQNEYTRKVSIDSANAKSIHEEEDGRTIIITQEKNDKLLAFYDAEEEEEEEGEEKIVINDSYNTNTDNNNNNNTNSNNNNSNNNDNSNNNNSSNNSNNNSNSNSNNTNDSNNIDINITNMHTPSLFASFSYPIGEAHSQENSSNIFNEKNTDNSNSSSPPPLHPPPPPSPASSDENTNKRSGRMSPTSSYTSVPHADNKTNNNIHTGSLHIQNDTHNIHENALNTSDNLLHSGGTDKNHKDDSNNSNINNKVDLPYDKQEYDDTNTYINTNNNNNNNSNTQTHVPSLYANYPLPFSQSPQPSYIYAAGNTNVPSMQYFPPSLPYSFAPLSLPSFASFPTSKYQTFFCGPEENNSNLLPSNTFVINNEYHNNFNNYIHQNLQEEETDEKATAERSVHTAAPRDCVPVIMNNENGYNNNYYYNSTINDNIYNCNNDIQYDDGRIDSMLGIKRKARRKVNRNKSVKSTLHVHDTDDMCYSWIVLSPPRPKIFDKWLNVQRKRPQFCM